MTTADAGLAESLTVTVCAALVRTEPVEVAMLQLMTTGVDSEFAVAVLPLVTAIAPNIVLVEAASASNGKTSFRSESFIRFFLFVVSTASCRARPFQGSLSNVSAPESQVVRKIRPYYS
jgi:hypothetical protein